MTFSKATRPRGWQVCQRLGPVLHLGLALQHLLDALGRGLGARQLDHQLADHHQREQGRRQVVDEGDDLAEVHAALAVTWMPPNHSTPTMPRFMVSIMKAGMTATMRAALTVCSVRFGVGRAKALPLRARRAQTP